MHDYLVISVSLVGLATSLIDSRKFRNKIDATIKQRRNLADFK